MGRRKRYVDDMDVNLSDYEETGDSDDERAKARKKMKYELKDSDEMDSSDEAPKVKVLPTPAPPTTTGADTLVQASVYYEPPEEEANVVEKVLSHRTRPSKLEEKLYGETIEEYYVKYKNFSYIHAEWNTYFKLLKGDKRFDQKLKRYKAKLEQLGPFAYVEDEPFIQITPVSYTHLTLPTKA